MHLLIAWFLRYGSPQKLHVIRTCWTVIGFDWTKVEVTLNLEVNWTLKIWLECWSWNQNLKYDPPIPNLSINLAISGSKIRNQSRNWVEFEFWISNLVSFRCYFFIKKTGTYVIAYWSVSFLAAGVCGNRYQMSNVLWKMSHVGKTADQVKATIISDMAGNTSLILVDWKTPSVYMTWHDMTWHDMTWHDMTWHDMTWRDIDPDNSQ